MAAIAIDGVSRAFGAVQAVSAISLKIGDGELFTLLGPSGCGKTTLLRMIAGFEPLDGGRISLGTQRIDTLPPHRRNTGMVFQNYAIFPNLTVAANIAYGLKARRLAQARIAERVAQALSLVRLEGYGTRWPHQLSGGQLQRVAIARALVIEPAVLLLDEPLSNLDAKLRLEMRGEIRRIQRTLGITTVYVTHDQEEALAISDRIAVMQSGGIEQVAEPQAIYRRPATPFVAEFMGTTNLFTGRMLRREGAGAVIALGGGELAAAQSPGRPGDELALSLRPEALRLLAPDEHPPAGWAPLEARLVRLEFLGALVRLEGALPDGTMLRAVLLDASPEALAPGARLRLAYDPRRVTVFPP